MPDVKFLGKWQGVARGKRINARAGDVVTLDERTARVLCKHGAAEPVETSAVEPVEVATVEPVETADQAAPETRETREVPAKVVRAWAQENGFDVPARGAIPTEVREAYEKAHADD